MGAGFFQSLGSSGRVRSPREISSGLFHKSKMYRCNIKAEEHSDVVLVSKFLDTLNRRIRICDGIASFLEEESDLQIIVNHIIKFHTAPSVI